MVMGEHVPVIGDIQPPRILHSGDFFPFHIQAAKIRSPREQVPRVLR